MCCHFDFFQWLLKSYFSIFIRRLTASVSIFGPWVTWKSLWVSFLSKRTSLKMLDILASSCVSCALIFVGISKERFDNVYSLFPVSLLYLYQNCWLSFAELRYLVSHIFISVLALSINCCRCFLFFLRFWWLSLAALQVNIFLVSL